MWSFFWKIEYLIDRIILFFPKLWKTAAADPTGAERENEGEKRRGR
jgi:hypothetical protein